MIELTAKIQEGRIEARELKILNGRRCRVFIIAEDEGSQSLRGYYRILVHAITRHLVDEGVSREDLNPLEEGIIDEDFVHRYLKSLTKIGSTGKTAVQYRLKAHVMWVERWMQEELGMTPPEKPVRTGGFKFS